MSSPGFLSVGDVHISDNPPGSRRDDYKSTVLGKLEMVRKAAVSLKVSGVLFTGDIFHLQKALRNSHSLVRSLIELLKSFPCPCWVAPGNHDLKNDRLDSLPHQPLGVVLESGAMRLLEPGGVVLPFYKGVGEGSGLDFRVRLAATSYSERDPLPECHAVKKGDADYLITVGHFFSSSTGGSFDGKPCLSYQEMAETETDTYVMGHFHHDQGIQRVGDTFFVNLGSLTRGILVEDSITRDIRIGHISLRSEGGRVIPTLKAIRLPVALSCEIFDLEKHEEIKKEKKVMDAFVQDLQEAFAQVPVGELGEDVGPLELLRQMVLDEEVLQEVHKRVREAEVA